MDPLISTKKSGQSTSREIAKSSSLKKIVKEASIKPGMKA